MKSKYTKHVITAAVLLACGAVAYPLYAANKDNSKVVVQKDPQQNTCNAVVCPQPGFAPVAAMQWDPFAEFIQMRQEMNNLMNGFFNHYQASPQWDDSWDNAIVEPACDVRQKGDKYIVTMDMPGLKKEDIKVKLDGNVLSVSGKRETKVDKKENGKMLLQERTFGSFSRIIRLPGKIKQDKVEATYENGTLKLEIPLVKPVDNSVEIPIK